MCLLTTPWGIPLEARACTASWLEKPSCLECRGSLCHLLGPWIFSTACAASHSQTLGSQPLHVTPRPCPHAGQIGCLSETALHRQDWTLWKQQHPALLSQSRNDSTVSHCVGTFRTLPLLGSLGNFWPLSACLQVPATFPLSWFHGDTHAKQLVMGPSLESWPRLVTVSDLWWGLHLNPGCNWLLLAAGGWPTFPATHCSSLTLSLPHHNAHRWLERPLPPGLPPPAYLDEYHEAQFCWESIVVQ